jgi:protein-S-isoprenylcysteine O-methyltransferase Ste14
MNDARQSVPQAHRRASRSFACDRCCSSSSEPVWQRGDRRDSTTRRYGLGVKRKDVSALTAISAGVLVQVGDRALAAWALRGRTTQPEPQQWRSVRSPFYLRPAMGSLVALAANRARRGNRRGAALFALGSVTVVTGIALRAWSLGALGEFYSPVVEVGPDHPVVRNGPYRFVRHPGYLAGLLQSVGVGLMFESVVGAAAMGVSWSTVFLPRIAEEEGVLVSALGRDYEDFCRGRARLVPGIW